MHEWIDDLSEQVAAGNPCVLVTVAGTRGSVPREPGAKMLVTEHETIGTIGGGQLEYQCTRIACRYLRERDAATSFRKFTLGANLGQCCGGIVEVLFEPLGNTKPAWLDDLKSAYRQKIPMVIATTATHKHFLAADGRCIYSSSSAPDDELVAAALRIIDSREPATKFRLELHDGGEQDVLLEPLRTTGLQAAIFGAGHVGTAVVRLMASLDCNVRWIDNRRNIFPDPTPRNVQAIECEHPELEVAAMPRGSAFLVMTHSHALDLEIVHRVLKRDDFIYCGLIGSMSKRRQFEKRMRKLGMTTTRLERLTCPIGIDGIHGKKPAEIAIAVVAELLQIRHANTSSAGEEVAANVRFLHD